MTLVGSEISNAGENDSGAVSFPHLKLRRKHKDYVKTEESKVGTVLQDS